MGKIFSIIGHLADDGKRFDALDVVWGAGGYDRGGSLREGSGYGFDGQRFDAVDVLLLLTDFLELRESEGGEG